MSDAGDKFVSMRLVLIAALVGAMFAATAAAATGGAAEITILFQATDSEPAQPILARVAVRNASVDGKKAGAAVFSTRQELDKFKANLPLTSTLRKELDRKRPTLMSLSFLRSKVVLVWLRDSRHPVELISVDSAGRHVRLTVREVVPPPPPPCSFCTTTTATVAAQLVLVSRVLAAVDASAVPAQPIVSVSVAPQRREGRMNKE